MRCSKCGKEEFAKDGTTKHPYGVRQRLKCKGCGKITGGAWIVFDRKAYQQAQSDRFKEYQLNKRAYDEAKKESGYGGFRLEDL